jgi:histidine triad (HIT) family protein
MKSFKGCSNWISWLQLSLSHHPGGINEVVQHEEVREMEDDFYCKEVIPGIQEVRKVAETQNVLAFHHTRPQYPVHIVVIPKRHISSLLSFSNEDNDLLLEMMSVLQDVVQKVNEQYGCCRLTTNFGSCQTTKHLHWHVYVSKEMMA